jgi:hypothetical protein
MIDNRQYLDHRHGLVDMAPRHRFWPCHPRLLHFVVAAVVAFPRVFVAALIDKWRLSDGPSMVLEGAVYFVIGIAVGVMLYPSIEGAVTAWLGYWLGQFAGYMVFGAWNWFLAYALASAILAWLPAGGDLIGSKVRGAMRRRTGSWSR